MLTSGDSKCRLLLPFIPVAAGGYQIAVHDTYIDKDLLAWFPRCSCVNMLKMWMRKYWIMTANLCYILSGHLLQVK